jgi:hypothetical protein
MKDDGRDLVFSSTNILFFDVFELCVVYYQQAVQILHRPQVIPCTAKVFIEPVKAWTMLLEPNHFISKN